MINLKVFNMLFLEITVLPVDEELAPVVRPIFWWVLLTGQLLQGLHYGVVCRIEEERN